MAEKQGLIKKLSSLKLNLSILELFRLIVIVGAFTVAGYKGYIQLKELNKNLSLIVKYFEIDPQFKAMKKEIEKKGKN